MAYYAMIDQSGNVLSAYGTQQDSKLLKPDFWNSLKPIAKSMGYWSVFESMRNARESCTLQVSTEQEKKNLYVYPMNYADWNLVVFLDDQYVLQSFEAIWEPVQRLVVRISISITGFLIAIITINVLIRIRASEQNSKLKDEADTDLLTELNNKIAAERKIKEYMLLNPQRQAIMLIIDVDNFKKINDTMGHAFGDEVLRELGMRLSSMFRVTDIIGRVGGDEFLVFLKDIENMEAMQREGEKLEQFFHQFEVGKYVKYSITGSIGGAIFPTEGECFEALYKAADKALYESKKQGKNRVTFYSNIK